MSAKRHRHEFTLFYAHFGPYGDQGVHYHPCFDEDCDRVLIGEGRECGTPQSHRRATLSAALSVSAPDKDTER